MWQRFTERARRLVFYAQEEAQKFGEGYVSTEHLLLAVAREPDSTAGRLLEHMGVNLNRVRAEVEKQLPRGDARPSQDMTLTPRAKRTIDLAYDEARGLGDNFIGTEHLLLGLIREGDGLAGRVMAKLGVELDRAREGVPEVRAANPDVESAPGPPPLAKQNITNLLQELLTTVDTDAKERGVRFCGTHDLLSLLLDHPESIAFKALTQAGVDIDALKAEISGLSKLEPIPGASGLRSTVLVQAMEEGAKIARSMGDPVRNTGHYLLGMFVMSWSSVSLMLMNQGIYYEHLWILVGQLFGQEE